MPHPGPFLQHLLLIYFNIVIINGCIKHWSLPDIPNRLELNVRAQLGLQLMFQPPNRSATVPRMLKLTTLV